MIRLAALVLVFTGIAACTDDGPSQAAFDDALDGVPSDPDSYQLTIVDCTNDGTVLNYTWGLKNLTQERRTFAFDPYLTNSSNEEEKKDRQLVAESVAPGEYMEWSGRNGGGERFPVGDVECRFEVVDSVLGEFRDEG